jgi:hypothetical protein
VPKDFGCPLAPSLADRTPVLGHRRSAAVPGSRSLGSEGEALSVSGLPASSGSIVRMSLGLAAPARIGLARPKARRVPTAAFRGLSARTPAFGRLGTLASCGALNWVYSASKPGLVTALCQDRAAREPPRAAQVYPATPRFCCVRLLARCSLAFRSGSSSFPPSAARDDEWLPSGPGVLDLFAGCRRFSKTALIHGFPRARLG